MDIYSNFWKCNAKTVIDSNWAVHCVRYTGYADRVTLFNYDNFERNATAIMERDFLILTLNS